MNITEIRQQYPQYNDMTDTQLAQALHAKFYSDLPYEQVASKLGVQMPEKVKTDDPGIMGSIGIGFGRMTDNLMQGVTQAGAHVMGAMNPALKPYAEDYLARQKQQQQFKDEGYKPLQEQHPIATAVGESAPLLAVPAGGSLRAAMALGALPGLIEYGTPEEKLARGGAGAAGNAVGLGVGKVIGKALSPGLEAASPEAGRLADVMASNGIPLDAAQVTGNQVLQNTKAALAKIPWTANGQQARDAAKQTAFNQSVLKFIGSDAKAATPDVMGDAYNAITSKMNDAANSVTLQLDEAALNKLGAVEKNFLRRLPTDQKQIVKSYIDDILEAGANGGIPGDIYNKTRSDLGKLAFDTENSTIREGVKGIQKVLDDAFDRQAPKEAVDAMREARAQYSKYQTVANSLKKARSTDGNIPAKQLYAQAQHDIPGFERKTGDFVDLVRGGRQFLPDPIPNSGTPERALYQNLLTAGSMSGLGAASGALAGGDPISGASLGLAGFGLSKGAQGLLNSPMLTKYLMAKVLEERKKELLAQGMASAGLLGATALSR